MMNAQEINGIVKQQVAMCTEFFKQNGWVGAKWMCSVTTSFSTSRKRSWGGIRKGRPFISLALSRFTAHDGVSFYEYKSFSADPEIGSVLNDTVKAVRALVIHEMCHAVQYSSTQAASCDIDGEDASGHGALWKRLYRMTRNALLNSELTVHTPVIKEKPQQKTVPVRTMKRAEAFSLIATYRRLGVASTSIIKMLVSEHHFKKSTATTYVYAVK